jgi:peptide deformylase
MSGFVMWPDKRLRSVSEPVEAVTEETRRIWDQMILAMEAMPGVGLAAIQLGIPLRLAVVDASEERGRVIRMANPEILHRSVKMRSHDEGSPNLPGVWAKVERPRAVTVAFLNEHGARIEQELVGLWATSAQHQVDHMNGRMFFDHLSKVKRDMLIKKSLKQQGAR